MSTMPEEQILAPWRRLAETLAGSFAARARGLLASEFAIMEQGGGEVGRLRIDGREGAKLEAGDLQARIERTGLQRYAMLSGGAQILTAESAGASTEIRCPDRLYEVRISLLRNTAEAGPPGGEVVARVTGGLTNRSYEASFDVDDACSLPAAFFLLYRTVSLRREAYRA